MTGYLRDVAANVPFALLTIVVYRIGMRLLGYTLVKRTPRHAREWWM